MMDLEKLKEIGAIVRQTLDAVKTAVRPGVSTGELDRMGGRILEEQGAQSAPPVIYGFPGNLCISVNEEALHGIPGRRVLKEGDLVKLDLVAEKDGYFADAAVTVEVGAVSAEASALRRCAETAFRAALGAARAGHRVYDIGAAVEKTVKLCGFQVLKEHSGHGVGRTIHEEPAVPNFRDTRCRARLSEGLVLTIEPIIAKGTCRSVLLPDRWTVKTADGSLSAHYEHTVVITNGAPILLTC